MESEEPPWALVAERSNLRDSLAPALLEAVEAAAEALERLAALTSPCVEQGSCPHTICIRIREARQALARIAELGKEAGK